MDEAKLGLTLGRLEGKVDQILDGNERAHERIDAAEARVRKLEHQRSWFLGACAAISAGVAGILKQLGGN